MSKQSQRPPENLAFPSIFDSNTDECLWKRINNRAGMQVWGPMIYTSKLEKNGKRFPGLQITRYYFLYDKVMAYGTSNNPSKAKKYLNLEGIKFRITSSNQPGKFNLNFYRSNNSFQLIVKDRQVLEDWKRHLGQRCVMLDFEQHYVQKELLGTGAEAKVFLAENTSEGKKYAVKIFDKKKRAARLLDPKSLLEEIKVIQNMKQENIVGFHHIFESENFVHLVLEYIEGGDLETYLNNKPLYEEKDAKALLISILKGLVFLHSKGIVHRDLKPSNIMLRSLQNDTEIKLIDFGHSADIKHIRDYSMDCGTPGYIAPEIFSSSLTFGINQKCDVFSAGAIFYELLTGHKLFEAPSCGEVFRLNRKCAVDFSLLKEKQISNETINLLRQMLEWDPEKRLTSGKALERLKSKRYATSATIDQVDTEAFEGTFCD